MTENITHTTSPADPTAENPERVWHEGSANLFDRADARTSGHSYILDRATLLAAVERMSWHEATDGLPMPWSPGMAVKALVQVAGLPQVDRIAWDGAVSTRDDYEGPGAYTVVGVQASAGAVTFRVIAVDRGTDLVVAFIEWWARPLTAWIVTADVTTTATAHVEAETEEEAHALALVALTSDGTDPADVSIADVERF